MGFLPKSTKIRRIKAKGIQNVVITQEGNTYYWPLQEQDGTLYAQPMQVPVPNRIKIADASLGYEFVILLSTNGLLYSFGKDNQCGQLGHGDKEPR